MITAHALWTDRERFLGEASSGHAMIVDGGAEKSANSPVELLLIALCACSATDVVGVLRKKREPFTALDVRAEADRSETFPKVFTSIRMVYRVSGKVTRKAMEEYGPSVGRKVLFGVSHDGEVGEDRIRY